MTRPFLRAHVAAGVVVLLFSALSLEAQELMPASSAGWSAFSARPATAPATAASSATPYALQVYGNNVPNVYGGWRASLSGVSGGAFYRFRATATASGIASLRDSVTVLLRWHGSFGDEVAPDYVWEYSAQADGSIRFDRTLQAPPGATSVVVELILQWASTGTVRFAELSFAAAATPAARPVRAIAMSYRPSGTSSGLDSVQRAERYGEQVAATADPDVMVFGEMLNVIGAPGTYDAKAETVPGPSTDTMAVLARTYSTYVVFGMLERDGNFLYNSAILIDRNGAIAGKYRKMQLPLTETSAGITRGDDVPVFQTDFGKVALLICQDTAFSEPARQAAVQGAEILLVPIWGGKPALMAARALEHSVYVVASGYDYASEVLDPMGSVLARVPVLNQPDTAAATIDLSRRYREDWLGHWRDIAGKERRSYKPIEWTPATGGTPPPPPPPPPNAAPTVTLTAPTNGATMPAPATITIAASAADSDGSVTQVEFYAGGTLLATDTSSPFAITWSNVSAGTYALTARAVDNAGAATTSSPVTVTVSSPPPPSGLPAPWTSQDIGAVGLAGSATFGNGAFSVKGAGTDIWGNADAFQYVWQPVRGDADIVARVSSVENIGSWVKAGVMIRERLTADSVHALMLVSAAKGLAFQRRVSTGAISTSTGIPGAAPTWIKLERRGNVFSGYYSGDGATWTLVASETIAMQADVYVGLAVTSHTTSQLATGRFDSVTVRAGGLPAPWQTQDIGAVGLAGDVSASGGAFTVRGAGADVWDIADAFRYVWQPLHGDGVVLARVTQVEFVQSWTKAGVMIRESLSADSPHAFMLASAGKGLAFQRRVAAGAISASTSGIPVSAPVWVRLERTGNVITGSWSNDGVTWTVVGSETFAMAADVYVGLAVTSHDATRLATATFDGVSMR